MKDEIRKKLQKLSDDDFVATHLANRIDLALWEIKELEEELAELSTMRAKCAGRRLQEAECVSELEMRAMRNSRFRKREDELNKYYGDLP